MILWLVLVFVGGASRQWREYQAYLKRAEPPLWTRLNLGLALAALLLMAAPAAAQQNLGTIGRGATPAAAPTTTCVDVNHCGLDINIVGGGGSGGTASNFGAAFPATGTAVGFKDTGNNMAPGLLDAAGRIIVACGSGCAGAAGDGTATGALNALNAAVSIALSTYNGADVNFTAGGSLNGTVVAEVSNDGGTTWVSAVFADPTSGAVSTSLASPTSGTFFLAYPGSISHARVRVSVFTSGSTTANLRTTATNPMVMNYGSDGTNLRPFALTTAGVVKVDLSATAANATAIKVDGSAVTQPVSGTVTANQGGAPWTVKPDATVWTLTGTSANVAVTNTPTVTANAGSGTFTVSGTVTANQGTSPWVENVSQFGGSNVVTGTGASGAGIPRVTIANDSSLAANQSVNVNQWGGAGTTLGQKAMAASVPVAIASDQSAVAVTGTVTTTPPANATTNVTQFGGTNVSTGTGASGAGIPRVTVANDSNILATQSGTWTVQPGNTANTTPWLTTISQGGNAAVVNASGQLSIVCANCSGSGASAVDQAPFVAGTSVFAPSGGEYNPTATPLTSGQQGMLALTANRAALTNNVDSAGQELGASLPNKYSPPMVVALAPTLPKAPPLSAGIVAARAESTPVTFATATGGKGSSGLRSSIQCDQSVPISTAASGNTQLVAPVAGKAIYVCGYTFVSTSALSVKFTSGTGTACGTGTVDITGAMAVAANGGVVNPTTTVPALYVPLGQALCVNLSGATQVSGHASIAQF